MAGGTEPYVLGPGEGRFIDLGDFGMTVKASETETAGVVSVLEADEPPGFGPPIHVHHDCAEAFYVLDGEYVMYLEDREVVCPAGSFIFIPRRPARVSGWRRPEPKAELLLSRIHDRILRGSGVGAPTRRCPGG